MTPQEKLTELKTQAANGIMPDCIFFWRGFMSQWVGKPFTADNTVYKTAEHYMTAKKAECFGDEKSLQAILLTKSPRAAKAIGREVVNYNDKVWSEKRYQIIVDGNIQKFTQDTEFQNQLIGTANKVLVEASPEDSIWGIKMSENDPKIHDPRNWQGQNLLGFALMEVRDYFKYNLNKSLNT
jgi:ribA/ribD-fused uncharacterized protein